MTSARIALTLTAAALAWMLPGCGDDPFRVIWRANPDTALLYSLSLPEIGLPSAFDFHPTSRRAVEVEAPGSSGTWDLALDTRDGAMVFSPPSELGVESRAGIASFPGMTLEELQEAPSDSAAYSLTEPVPVETTTAYVVRTRETRGSFGRICVYYAELRPVEVDPVSETVRFVFDVNPDCNDRSLVPDEQP